MPKPRKPIKKKIEKSPAEKALINQKIRKKMLKNGEAKNRAIKGKMRIALGKGFLTYTEFLKASGLVPKTFKKYRKEMLDDNEIIKVTEKGKKGYSLATIRSHQSLEILATSVLHQSLTDIQRFNQLMGSLVAYTLKNYEIEQAMNILRTVLYEVEGYIKQPAPEQDHHLLIFGTPTTTTKNAESPEWKLWKDIDSRKYITTVTVQGKDKLVSKEAFDFPRFQKDWLNNAVESG